MKNQILLALAIILVCWLVMVNHKKISNQAKIGVWLSVTNQYCDYIFVVDLEKLNLYAEGLDTNKYVKIAIEKLP